MKISGNICTICILCQLLAMLVSSFAVEDNRSVQLDIVKRSVGDYPSDLGKTIPDSGMSSKQIKAWINCNFNPAECRVSTSSGQGGRQVIPRL